MHTPPLRRAARRAVRIALTDLDPLALEGGPVRAVHWTTVQGGRDLESTGHDTWDTLHWIRMQPSEDRVIVVIENFLERALVDDGLITLQAGTLFALERFDDGINCDLFGGTDVI